MSQEKILIIEDDEILAQGVRMNLSLAGFAAETAKNLREGEEKLTSKVWSLLFWMSICPMEMGFLCKKIKRKAGYPIIF